MNFYLNAFVHKNRVHYTAFEDGKRVKRKEYYKPYLFVTTDKHESEWKGFDGSNVEKIDFNSMFDARQFLDQYNNVPSFKIFGNTNWLYVWLNDRWPGQVEFDQSKINVVYLDIEVASDAGIPQFANPDKEITAITIAKNGKKITFGCKEYIPKSDDVMYVKCDNEEDLLRKYLSVWNNALYSPDVVTGWNVEGFDIPYLYERISRLLGAEEANTLSPWGIVTTREVYRKGGRIDTVYDLRGIATLDYLQLYQKFKPHKQESYTLNYIAHDELGEKKIDYSEYESLLELYKQDYEKFIDYNIHDVVLVERLEQKMRYIEQVFAIAYDGKVLYPDALTTVRLWDTIIHNYLFEQNVAVPNVERKEKENIMGGYVKEPSPGMYKWVVSFDLTSLYPHLIMQYNVGPETFVGKLDTKLSVEQVYQGGLKPYHDELVSRDVACTANLCLYRRDKAGVFATLMERVFNDRKRYKDKMLRLEEQYEKTGDEKYKTQIPKYDNLQYAKKIQINAAYGAIANEWFRFYDADNAEAITSTGQFIIRSIARDVNTFVNALLRTDGVDYCIASDTDSIYVSFEEYVKTKHANDSKEEIIQALDVLCDEKITPYIQKCCVSYVKYTNAFKQRMFMKRECITDKVIWTTKKRYILNVWDKEKVRYKEPKLKFVGIEAVRSTTPQSCRESIKEAVKVIMNEDENALQDYVNEFRKTFKQLPPADVGVPTTANNVDEYADQIKIFKKSTPAHVKGALIYNHILKEKKLDTIYPLISNSDKIKWVYLKLPNPVRHSSIAFINALPPQLNLVDYIDYDKQFQKGFLAPVERIANAIGWKTEEEDTLERFLV